MNSLILDLCSQEHDIECLKIDLSQKTAIIGKRFSYPESGENARGFYID